MKTQYSKVTFTEKEMKVVHQLIEVFFTHKNHFKVLTSAH